MKIYYRKTEERVSFVNTILEIFKDEIKGKQRVLVKPNLVSSENYPTTTHAETLESVLSFLSKLDCRVLVGDGPAFNVNSKKVINAHVLRSICSKYNISFINFHEAEQINITGAPGEKYKLKISNIPLTCDYIISLPTLKTHRLKNIGLSCALKNQFGYLCNRLRFKSHICPSLLPKYIGRINSIVKTDLFIIDAVEVLLNANEIRHGGYKNKLGVMFAGKDPVALDSYGLTLLKDLGEKKLSGKNALDIGYIREAARRNLGSTEYEIITI